jgi:sodium/potassium-transporting ATPase subunit alpha
LSDEANQIEKLKVMGDASETALLKFVQPFQPVEKIRNYLYKIARDNSGEAFFHHFDSVNKYSFGIANSLEEKNQIGKGYSIFLKGAPEKIWNMCTSIRVNGANQLIDKKWDH